MFPKLSKIEYLILNMLRNGRGMYGLEMVKASNGTLKRGTVYVTLTRMQEKGFLTSIAEKDPKHAGLPRREYSISGHGQSILHAIDAAELAMSGGVSHGVN